MGQTEPVRLVFMGTPDLAAVVLKHVLDWPGGRVVAVYCQPDRPAGRGMSLKAPPVKLLALERGLPVRQPPNFRGVEDVAVLRSYAPDYLLVAAYGLILPQRVLDIPTRLALNVHTSLLPRYRGAAPIQRAIMNGDMETGVTIMAMEAGMDTGPVILQKTMPIGPNDTAADLHDRLAHDGGLLLVQTLEGLEGKKLTCTPQNDKNATYAPKLNKTDGAVNFGRSSLEIHALVRGVTPWPGAFAILERQGEEPLTVNILKGFPALEIFDESLSNLLMREPGAISLKLVENALAVRCADGIYLISALRPSGRKAMDAAAFMNGYVSGRYAVRFTTL